MQKDIPLPHEVEVQAPVELPTTPDIAHRGVAIYKAMLYNSTPGTRTILRTHRQMRGLFTGITPEIGGRIHTVNAIDERVLDELDAHFRHYFNEILLVRHHTPMKDGGTRMSMVNLRAAERVMRQHPDLFPENARESPMYWLQTYTDLWCMNGYQLEREEAPLIEARYGVLSGYPKEAATNFVTYLRAREKCRAVEPQLADKVWAYTRHQGGYAVEDRQQLAEDILLKTGGILSSSELKSLLDTVSISSARLNFFGTDYQRDTDYVRRLEAIYAESGIEQLT